MAQWDGTFVGELRHPIEGGRSVKADFVGSVAGRVGTLEMRILVVWGDPTTPGHRGKWVILSGDGELQNLHGQGTFYFESDYPADPYKGKIQFSGK